MKVLVTGASGFIGSPLVKLLNSRGHEVIALSTRKNATMAGAQTFWWNPDQYEMDENALHGVEGIIHLAGATISKRWTPTYKQEIFDSRTRTAETLFRAIAKLPEHGIKSFVSASAVGYYKSDFDKTYAETDGPGTDFLAQVCTHWEAASDKLLQLNIRVAKLRTGIVLGRGGGVLGQLEPVTKLGLGAPLGSGKQWMSWIHLTDLCSLFVFALENDAARGALNAGGPAPVTNKALSKALAKALNRPFFLPAVPEFALKMALGEMATIALMSQKTSEEKTHALGFSYQFKTIDAALNDLYR